jgi:uncharacterized membrane protein YccC
MLGRPPQALLALGGIIGFLNTVGLATSYQDNFANFVNGSTAQIAGTGLAIIVIGIFHVVGAELALARLLRAGFRDIAARADGRERNTRRWASRMLDRAALIAFRANSAAPRKVVPPYDALLGLRIGFLAGELHALLPRLATSEDRRTLSGALRGIAEHFRRIGPSERVSPGEPLLHAIDRAIAVFVADPLADRRRSGLILLTGLRRSLFPHAVAFARPH